MIFSRKKCILTSAAAVL